MVNSKKMSKSTVAIVLLSLLLVLSLILTATGAWFTDHKSGASDDTRDFGVIHLNTASMTSSIKDIKGVSIGKDENVMPGDVITLTGLVKLAEDSDKAYVFITLSGNDAKYTLAATDWIAVDGQEGVYYAVMEASNEKTLTLTYDTKDVNEDYTDAAGTLQHMGKPVLGAVTINVAAIQFRNFDNATEAYAQAKTMLA